ncbi:hypothetical protein ACWFR1_12110 [Streptomyces sp. NPDC055103]
MPVEPLPCAAPEPEPPIPPCCSPGLASTGLCLADGTPIAVLAVTACADCGTTAAAPEQTGWLNLLTGAFTAGPPPVGSEACTGQPAQFEVGQWCDLDADGKVIAPVLVEYEYGEDGQLTGVRTLTPAGDPYTPAGTLGICPGPVDDVEYVILCDVHADGTVTEFLRALTPNGDDTSTARDTTLDGATPYTPTGMVGVCQPEAEPCRDTATVLLCDAPATTTVTVEPAITDGTPADVGQTQFPALPGPYTSLWTGGSLLYPADPGPAQSHRAAVGKFTASPSGCDNVTGTLTVSVRVTQNGPGTGQLWDGALRLFRGTTALATDDVALYAPPGHVQTLTVSAPVTAADLAAGDLACALILETFHGTPKSWTADQFTATVELTGCDETRAVQFLRTLVTDCETGETVSQTDTTLDGEPYTVAGEVGQCEPAAGECCPPVPPETRLDTETSPLCIVNDATGDVVGQVLTVRVWDDQTGVLIGQSYIDPVTSGAVTIPAGTHLAPCPEPCRDTSSTLLCDTATTDVITVLDPAHRPNADGWQVVSFTGANPGYGPQAPMPYPAPYGALFGYPALGARSDQNAGSNGVQWSGYDNAPVRWVLRKTFTAPEDGVAVVQSVGFRGDGGARVRVNGQDAGMYGQWNQPATSGTAQIPVTAGPNTIEIEVRDVNGINNVTGRLDVSLPHTTQFMRRQTVDCATGEVIATHDTTLDGEPYTVAGEVGQCEPVAECCEQAAPEQRLDVETTLLCIRDTATGEVLDQVLVERVYDDQTGELVEQRITDPTTAAPVTLPGGAELARCPSPDRITRQVCVVSSGSNEFLTNAANATSGQDTDWVWSPNQTGPWYPMYRVSPNPLWTVTDPAPNKAHWVGPHADRTVCPTAGETSPLVPGTWYTRASWNLPANVDPATIRIGASILNADNDVVQWRLNDGAWQPVAGGQLAPPAWSFPPTAVPGGRAGQNEIIVQILEMQPAVTCPSGNSAGMILHVTASYDYEPRVWTQVIEDGRVYYLDENGDQQADIPPGDRIVSCGGGGECCPWRDAELVELCDVQPDGSQVRFLRALVFNDADPATPSIIDLALDGVTPYTPTGTVGACRDCPASFDTECVKQVVNGWSYDNTTASASNCGSVQGPIVGPGTTPQFPCAGTGLPTAYQITSWIIDGVELVTSPLTFQNGPCGDESGNGLHDHWAGALTQLDPSATWVTAYAPGCAWYVRSDDAPADRVYGTMRIRNAGNTAQVWTLGPEHSYTETLYTKVFTQECDGTVTVTWLDAQGVETDPPAGPVVSCGAGGEAGPDVEVLELCDVDPVAGTVVPFLRALTYRDGLTAPTVTDTALDGTTPYSASGTVGLCQQPAEDCRNSSTLLLCDVPTDGAPAPTVTDTAPTPYYPYPTGLPMAGAQALWDGSALTVPPGSGPQPGTTGTVRTMAASIQAPRPGCDTGTARVTVSVDAEQQGPDAGCAVTGALRLFTGTTILATALPANNAPVGWSGTLTVEADVPAADVAAGNLTVLLALDVYDDSPVACPGSPRKTSWQLSGFTTSVLYEQTGCAEQFLRTVTTDCETGAVTATSDTTLDGQPYTPTGEPGQCAAAGGGSCCPEQPCGDTELAQLCDLTYDPQAPIATPARDFALTGNVVAANNGTTLWFAQANQAANGVAQLTVGGLLPAVMYEFRFASAWIGAGNPTPATNNAVYLLEILDGTTVLANRTRNVSNGSNVFPGGVLSEDLPPVAFTAPPTGAVTIRFTDQTTGGPINDRDLFLMPLEVRTETLTLTSTPFLRRFTFDCDGDLTTTQDLALDGATPYVVQGEAGHCTSDGGTASAVTPCDVQNVIQACRCDDTDGDGIADTDYVELLGVDCEGVLTSLGTYTPDYEPYTPLAPVECDTAGADPATGVQARRVELTAGQTWNAAAWPTLQSVTAVARGTGTITTADGTSSLVAGESATWSVARDDDAVLTGPLTIAADTGTIAVSFTTGATL